MSNDVKILELKDFFETYCETDVKLEIPDYQRPYTWSERNALQLVDDIRTYQQEGYDKYRIGTVILHHPENDGNEGASYHIVDGQQRVVTFCLIIDALRKILPRESSRLKDLNEIHFPQLPKRSPMDNNKESARIRGNYHAIRQNLVVMTDDSLASFADYFWEHCAIAVFETNDLGEAFQLFDSQNSRGKALDPTDLLKAYHLRQIAMLDANGNDTRHLIERWEAMNPHTHKLFSNYLYRIRMWSENRSVVAQPFDASQIEWFKGVDITRKQMNANWTRAFIYAYNFVMQYNAENSLSIQFGAIQPLEYPYQIDHTVLGGSFFFDYVDHYYRLCVQCGIFPANGLNEEILPEIADSEVFQVLDSDEHCNDGRIARCRNLFDCLLLYYVDRFGRSRLPEAVRAIFVYAFTLRIRLSQVQSRSIDKFVLGYRVETIGYGYNAFSSLRLAGTPAQFLADLAVFADINTHDGSDYDWLMRLYRKMKNSTEPKN